MQHSGHSNSYSATMLLLEATVGGADNGVMCWLGRLLNVQKPLLAPVTILLRMQQACS